MSIEKIKSPYDFKTLFDLLDYFSTEEKCLEYLVQFRWANGIRCTKCDSDKICRFSDCKRYKCCVCKTQFNAKTNTIFQGTRLPLKKWFTAMYLIGTNKKGISTRQLAAQVGFSVPTSWFRLHSIRQSLVQDDVKLEGTIEADETFIGGKNKNRHIDKKVKNSQGRSFKDKTPVLGLLQREERTIIYTTHKLQPNKLVKRKIITKQAILKCKVIEGTDKIYLQPPIFDMVKQGSTLMTDEWKGYNDIECAYDRQTVDHGKKQFKNGDASTNGAECSWSHFKRMIFGCYHQVSKKHLHRYANEFSFRYTFKWMSQSEIIAQMMKNIEHPLKYKQLIAA